MPIIKSAKKRAKQSLVRRARNYNVRTALKKTIKDLVVLAKEGKKAEAEKILSAAYKAIDMATKRNVLHKNTAARRKSMLAKAIANSELPVKEEKEVKVKAAKAKKPAAKKASK
jgi:small subunit ribosomal protein S20